MRILGIESSCDETAAAVVEDGRKVLSNVVNTQIDLHRLYGGVVPEIASRQHIEQIDRVVSRAVFEGCGEASLSGIDAIAVTAWPGLIGALLTGVNFAKGLAFAAKKPLVPVHHIRGHIASNYISHAECKPPFLCLIVSGGHSNIAIVEDYTKIKLLSRTRDDAAGECFDKVARVLSLPYPGGVSLDKMSAGVSAAGLYKFPNPKVEGCPMDFSFSGLKTAAINTLHNAEQKGEELDKLAFAADFSEAVVNILMSRVSLALAETGIKRLAVAGGVSANSRLRREAATVAEKYGAELFLPELKYCGDNAAMIGAAGYFEFLAGNLADSSLNAKATMPIA